MSTFGQLRLLGGAGRQLHDVHSDGRHRKYIYY